MNKGGYYLLDCTGLNLSSDSEQTIPDIFDSAKTAVKLGKEVQACGCLRGSVEMSPVPVSVNVSGDNVIITGADFIVTVGTGNKATVTPSYPPLIIVTQPTNTSAASGGKADFTVVASGVGLTYEWWTKDTGASNFNKVGSAVSNAYSFTMNSSRDGREVYAVVIDMYGNSVQSNTVTATMTAGTTNNESVALVTEKGE